jgi:ABC-type molybdate transport system substrate-binding protein
VWIASSHDTFCRDRGAFASATREADFELVPQFECASGRKVETTWAGTVDIVKRISAGEGFDLIIAANAPSMISS